MSAPDGVGDASLEPIHGLGYSSQEWSRADDCKSGDNPEDEREECRRGNYEERDVDHGRLGAEIELHTPSTLVARLAVPRVKGPP